MPYFKLITKYTFVESITVFILKQIAMQSLKKRLFVLLEFKIFNIILECANLLQFKKYSSHYSFTTLENASRGVTIIRQRQYKQYRTTIFEMRRNRRVIKLCAISFYKQSLIFLILYLIHDKFAFIIFKVLSIRNNDTQTSLFF